uniref:G_PROTEIN_RECEP_F1_2 domain-containing protein n=1 Tax=Parastrongyloides trichosuri TaxID=131310 RepID=A0A0N4ZLK3_PARTI
MEILDRFLLPETEIPYQFINCSHFEYPHDIKYKDCSLPLDMTPCEAIKWVHLAKNFRTYFLAIIPFIISLFAIIINIYLLYCLIKYWKKHPKNDSHSQKKKQLIFIINKTISAIVALVTFYIVLLVWKCGTLQYSSASLFIIVGSLSFFNFIGFYLAKTILLYLAIVKPVYYKTNVTNKKCYIVVAIIWFAALSFSILIGVLGATLFYQDTAPISCKFMSCQDPIAITLTTIIGILYLFVLVAYIVMLKKMHTHTKGESRIGKLVKNDSIQKEGPKEEESTIKERKTSSSSLTNNIKAMNSLSINLCIFALCKLPFLILAIVTTINLYHLSSLGELSKTPCKTFHFGKIYFEVEALASSAAIIWIIGMICDPIVIIIKDKVLKIQLIKHMKKVNCFNKNNWEPIPCFNNK